MASTVLEQIEPIGRGRGGEGVALRCVRYCSIDWTVYSSPGVGERFYLFIYLWNHIGVSFAFFFLNNSYLPVYIHRIHYQDISSTPGTSRIQGPRLLLDGGCRFQPPPHLANQQEINGMRGEKLKVSDTRFTLPLHVADSPVGDHEEDGVLLTQGILAYRSCCVTSDLVRATKSPRGLQ